MVELRFVCVLALAVTGCSDDGLPVNNQNDSGTSGATASATASATAPATTTDDGVDSVGGTAEGTAGTGPVGTGTDGPPNATESTGTDGPTGSTEGSSTGVDTDSSTGTETETDGCEPITEDASDIGTDCMSDMDCEPGYTCQPFNGFVFEQTCQILCTESCECPMGLTCQFTADKVTDWFQCV